VLDLHAEKVMELTKILHGELVLESTDGPLQKSHGGSCEDNIINVQQEIDCLDPSGKQTEKDLSWLQQNRAEEGRRQTD